MAAILKKYQLGWTDASDGTVYNFFFLAPPTITQELKQKQA